MEGLITRDVKPSNTEVLGLLLDQEKLPFITNLNHDNVKGLCKLNYLMQRLNSPEKNPIEITNKVIESYLAYKCSVKTKQGNRSDQVVDALKHIIEDENKDNIQSLAQQIQG